MSRNLLKLAQQTFCNPKTRWFGISASKVEYQHLKKAEVNEVRIDVPWGHVAGKWYGQSDKRPIVMIHGWQDNAGSFDRLIPLLPKHMSYLSIDLPGHGHSSRLPNGMCYTIINCLHVINLIQRHYNWSKISLLGHSMGNLIAMPFASLYPDRCDLLICLDGMLKPFQGKVSDEIEKFHKIGDDFLTLDILSRQEPLTTSYDALAEKWSKAINMTQDEIEPLMKRGVIQSKYDPNQYFLSRDIRLKFMEFGTTSISDDIRLELASHITAPHLFIKVNTVDRHPNWIKKYQLLFDILTKSHPKFEWHEVNGIHHCHLTQPKRMHNHLTYFFNKHLSSELN